MGWLRSLSTHTRQWFIMITVLLITQPTLLNVIQYWHNYDTMLMNKLSLVCQGMTIHVTD